ncbi:MAG: cytochrome P450 [Alphaproteobacteria bacterium]|nr:cytochrome P450 [Alphaproteobacteria bacterium]
MTMSRQAPAQSSPAWSMPLEKIDVSLGELYERGEHWEYFDRLRRDDPVHLCEESAFGPYWSITKFNDIVKVETNTKAFSSYPTIVIGDPRPDFYTPMFIAMDPPIHDEHRKAVNPAVGPQRLAELEPIIRERAGRILDSLPIGETFNWVDRVSIEMTTQMLATLFDVPFEDRYKLPFWSDVAASGDAVGNDSFTEEERRQHLVECLQYFVALWNKRVNAGTPGQDFISLLAHSPATRDMHKDPMLFLGTLMLLIVGGNDTTRNSLSGGVHALNLFPAEYAKLKANPALIPNMVSEIIRYQTPLAHMRRTVLEDVELNGKTIRKGGKVCMWYISGNRDDEVIENPYAFKIDRANARHHLSFGFGIHRCMGNRVAEMQLRIVWEEILKRFKHIEVVGTPVRTRSNFVHGFVDLPVRVTV